MTKQTINLGTTPNDNTGDPLRTSFGKVNNNFDELYVTLGDSGTSGTDGTDGTSGTDGTDGTSGTDGIDGEGTLSGVQYSVVFIDSGETYGYGGITGITYDGNVLYIDGTIYSNIQTTGTSNYNLTEIDGIIYKTSGVTLTGVQNGIVYIDSDELTGYNTSSGFTYADKLFISSQTQDDVLVSIENVNGELFTIQDTTGSTIFEILDDENRTIADAEDTNFVYRRNTKNVETSYYVISERDDIIMVSYMGVTTISLTGETNGRHIDVKDIYGNAKTNNIIILSTDSTIDGTSSYTIDEDYGSISLFCDGVNWFTDKGKTEPSVYKYNYQDYLDCYNSIPDWERPSEWPEVPDFSGDTEEVVYGLYTVRPGLFDDWLAVTISGNFSIDWGDGSDTEYYTSGTKAEHLYTFSGVTGGTLLDDGDILCLVEIRPSGGTDELTNVNLVSTPSKFGNTSFTNWKEVKMNVPNATNIRFYGNFYCKVENVYIGKNKVGSASTMFRDCHALENVFVDVTTFTNMDYFFQSCNSLTNITFSGTTSNVTSFRSCFYLCYNLKSIPEMDISNAVTLIGMFSGCIRLEQLPPIDTSSSLTIYQFFSGCKNLRSIPPGFDTSGCANLTQLFLNCYTLEYIPDFDTTSATNLSQMFANCINLKAWPKLIGGTSGCPVFTNFFNGITQNYLIGSYPEGLNLTGAQVLQEFFQGSTHAGIGDLLSGNTSNVENFSEMYRSFQFINTNEIPWMDMSSAERLEYFCYYTYGPATFPENLNTSLVTNVQNMFSYSTSFKKIPYFCITGCTNFTNMFHRAYTIEEIGPLDFSNATVMTNTFYLLYRLRRCQIIGPPISHSYNDCSLGPDALNEIFTNLPSGVTSQTITVTNNWGIGESGYDPTIATSKGWTVAD